MSIKVSSLHFEPNTRDCFIVEAALGMLEKLQRSDIPKAAERMTLSKFGLMLSKFPRCDFNDQISVYLLEQDRVYDDQRVSRYWQVEFEPSYLTITSGGIFYRESTGSDSFCCMHWSISKGEAGDYNEYSAQHLMVPDLKPFRIEVDEMDFTKGLWKLEIADEENTWLNEEEDEEENDVDLAITIPIPTSEAESELVSQIDVRNIVHDGELVEGIPGNGCEYCKIPSLRLNHIVDGLNRDGDFAWMCPDCWVEHGRGLGIGKGQLFTKQPSGKWICTTGLH